MSNKVKRKVTVENSKDNLEHPRRPSVFERLGPGAVNIQSQSQDRHGRIEQNEKCRSWLRTGMCGIRSQCRYQHDNFPNSSRRAGKAEKEIDEKDLRHKVRNKREEPKESRTGSVSPKRKGSKRSGSRSRKGDHESKIKSTVVVTRPRSPTSAPTEPTEKEKKKPDGSWEDDSDDWPMDAAQLDYKEELTLERKRQQLQRELELELQKERMLNENVTITKTVSFSESSSTSSSSDSGSISSSSDSSSSSSDDDSDESSSSSSSSSSSASQAPAKKKYKKPTMKKEAIPEKSESSAHQKPHDDYDKIKSSRAAKSSSGRTRSPVSPETSSKRGRDRRNITPPPAPSPKRRVTHEPSGPSGRGSSNIRARGPRTPSPVPVSRKQRQWNQSSSADSRSADHRRNRSKRHKKKKDVPRNDRLKSDYVPIPPRLSSPNRTALLPHNQLGKKSRQRAEDSKSRRRNREQSPLLLSRVSGPSNSPSVRLLGNQHYASDQDKLMEKQGQLSDRSKGYGRKSDDLGSRSRRGGSRDRTVKRSRLSPGKDAHRDSLSPCRDKYESDLLPNTPRKVYNSPIRHLDKEDKGNRRRRSPSPQKGGKDIRDRRKVISEMDKKRDVRETSPRNIDNRRDNQYRNNDSHGYQKKDSEPRIKRVLSPDLKKGRDDKSRERGQKDRNSDLRDAAWNDEQKKSSSLSGNRIVDPRGRQELPMQPPPSRNDRSRDRERDRKKGKEREPPIRTVEEVDRDRQRLPSPGRGQTDMHHPIREVEPSIPGSRRRMYEADLPPGERDYSYGYGSHRDSLYDRLLPPDYEQELIRGPLYPPSGYPEPEYRRDTALKDPGPLPHIERIGGYGGREVLSPRDILPPHDVLGMPGRDDDYLADIPIDERHTYEERWGRNRPMRDDWDPYASLPPAPLPVHVTTGLDEDRYGMPRRRRASPDWQLPRGEERDLSIREPRSRSPPHRRVTDGAPQNRASWPEHQDRHGSRSSDGRGEIQQKNQDDRKSRNNRDRRDRRDRGKRSDEPPIDVQPPVVKEKLGCKRTHSPSPPRKDVKKRKEDDMLLEISTVIDKTVTKKAREEPKPDPKPPVNNRLLKTIKNEPLSPKVDANTNSRPPVPDKTDAPPKTASSSSKVIIKTEREEKRTRRNNDDKMHDDEFSDWSDGDDDLLNRDDFIDNEANNGGERGRNRTEENKDRREKNAPEAAIKTEETNKQTKDHPKDSRQKPKDIVSQSRSRTGSKERVTEETSNVNKDAGPPSTSKDSEPMETYVIKDETATDVDDYITTESVDYDPISDDELEALIEEPDESVLKSSEVSEKSKIVDALDVNWSTLMSETKAEFVPGFGRKRFKAVHVLSRIGFSKSLAGSAMSKKILEYCQEQLDEEQANENKMPNDTKIEGEKFAMEHHIAAFHVAISESKKERQDALNHVGPFRRALCARRDLQIRKLLCRPSDKLVASLPTTYSHQYSNIDKELYKQSLELLKLKKNECQPQIINAC